MVPLYRAEVRIELKPGVADPEGANTKKALELLGFRGIQNVKSVHAFSIDLDAASAKDAQAQVDEMCRRLLVNPVIHAPRVTVASANGGAPARKAAGKAAPKAAKKAPRKAAPKKTAKKASVKKTARKVGAAKRRK